MSETNYRRYKPSSSVAPIGSQIIQFTYSEEFLNAMAAGDTVALHANLDAFAWKLCDEIDNPMGIAKSDIAILHDLYYVTEYRPYEFGDPWFAQPANGGTKFLLDQGPRYQADVLGDPVLELHTPDAYNHIDIFFKSSGHNQYAHPGESSANVADFGDEPGFPTRKTNRNGIILRSVPVGPDWSSYHVAIHELGHLFDITAYGSQDYWLYGSSNNKRGYGQEPRAQLGRRYVGISNELHFINGRPTGVPYNQCFYRHDEGPAGAGRGSMEELQFDYNPNTRGDAHGETMFAYMAEHFRGSSPTSVADDLAAEFMTNTYFEPNGERVANTYIAALGTLLEGQAYASESAYPYFFGPSGPLNGEDRLGVMWRNMAIAVAANAPNIDVGQYGFPFEYDPHFQWNYFKSITAHLDPPTPADRVETPVVSTITSNDYGIVRTIPSPFTMPDGSQYYSRVHPWNMEVFVLNVDADADPNGDRAIALAVRGSGEPYAHPTLDYRHEVYVSLVVLEDLQGGVIHSSGDKVMTIEHLESTVEGGDLVFHGEIPTYAGARHAMVVVTMTEKGMPEVYDSSHPLYNQPYTPWSFAVEYELTDIEAPLPEFSNNSVATGLTIPADSSPQSSVPLDFDDDGKLDLFVSFGAGFAQLNQNTFSHAEAPQFSDRAPSRLLDGSVENTSGAAAVDCLPNTGYGNVDLFIASSSGNLLLAGDGFDFKGPEADQSSLLGAAQFLPSTGASFGDFNGDRWLDIYVMSDASGTGDVLLQSNAGTGFTDVTSAAGLHTGMTQSTSAIWADMNLDNRLDLFVGWGADTGPSNEWSPYYLNQGPDTGGQVTFADVAGAPSGPRIARIGHVQGIAMADISGDRKLDILLASNDPAAATTLIACLNDGTGAFVQEAQSMGLLTQTPLLDVEVSDLNGNGVLDIVGVPDGTHDVVVFSGFGDFAGRGFRDASFEAALGSNPAFGLTLADFNADTDTDLFLLRPETGPAPEDKQFFWSNGLVDKLSPPPAPVSYTVAFDRWTQSQNPNSLAIGATVTSKVFTPAGATLYSTQVVDGGSGRAGQGTSRLTFGLAGASTAEITVRWPHGQQQVFDAASSPGWPNVLLTDTSDPEILTATVSGSYQPNGEFATHTYTWKSRFNIGTPQVLVDAGSKSAPECRVPLGGAQQVVIQAGDPGVGYTHAEEDDGQGGILHVHTITWTTYCSPMCNYKFFARHNVGGQVYSSDQHTLYVAGCPIITQ